jgi:hypothetical protein
MQLIVNYVIYICEQVRTMRMRDETCQVLYALCFCTSRSLTRPIPELNVDRGCDAVFLGRQMRPFLKDRIPQTPLRKYLFPQNGENCQFLLCNEDTLQIYKISKNGIEFKQFNVFGCFSFVCCKVILTRFPWKQFKN